MKLEQFDREHPVIAMGSREWTLRQRLMTQPDATTVHYFNGKWGMAYTPCWKLPFGHLAVKHTSKHEEVTCPTCLRFAVRKRVDCWIKVTKWAWKRRSGVRPWYNSLRGGF